MRAAKHCLGFPRAAAVYRTSPTSLHRSEHGDIQTLSLWLVFSDCDADLGVSGCSRPTGEHVRPRSVLHNGAEFGHMVRPTGVVSQCSKKVCTVSSGNAVFITPRPDGRADGVQPGGCTEARFKSLS